MYLPQYPLQTHHAIICVGTLESKAHYLIILNQSTLGMRNVAVFFHQPHSRVTVTNWTRATMTQFLAPVTSEIFKTHCGMVEHRSTIAT